MNFTALPFTAIGASPAAKRTRILPMTQYADNIWNEGKFLPSFTKHRRCTIWSTIVGERVRHASLLSIV
jgi:hypothetical protein